MVRYSPYTIALWSGGIDLFKHYTHTPEALSLLPHPSKAYNNQSVPGFDTSDFTDELRLKK